MLRILKGKLLVWLIVYSIVVPRWADAYIEPGIASQMLQILVAGVIGASVFIRGVRVRLVYFFGWLKRRWKLNKAVERIDREGEMKEIDDN